MAQLSLRHDCNNNNSAPRTSLGSRLSTPRGCAVVNYCTCYYYIGGLVCVCIFWGRMFRSALKSRVLMCLFVGPPGGGGGGGGVPLGWRLDSPAMLLERNILCGARSPSGGDVGGPSRRRQQQQQHTQKKKEHAHQNLNYRQDAATSVLVAF